MSDRSPDGTVRRFQWLVNPGEPPRRDVRVSVADGTVVEICDVPGDERSLIEPTALLPKFVNAHTHLEFSRLLMPLQPPIPFTDWIRSVIGYRRSMPDIGHESVRDSIATGLDESASAGTQLIGEITTSEIDYESLPEANGGQVNVLSFRELIGLSPERIDEQLQLANNHLNSPHHRNVSVGLSPHAPYSVHPELLEAVVDLAVHKEAPLAMHLAETADELQLLSNQSGDFVSFLKQLNLWRDDIFVANRTPLDYLQQLSKAPRALAIHGNYFGHAEISFLAQHPQMATVYCPRTHRYFGHPQHPWQRLQAAGATVILGTDSRASNPDLSIWRELQTVASQAPNTPLWELLPMITTTAAESLGFPRHQFRIDVGQPLNANLLPAPCDSPESLDQHLRQTASKKAPPLTQWTGQSD